jgi:hypothetical protein
MTLLLLTFTEKSQTLTVPKNLLIEHASKYDFSSYSHQSNRYVDPFVQNNLLEIHYLKMRRNQKFSFLQRKLTKTTPKNKI